MRGVSDIIYCSKDAQISFTQNFRLLTQLLKILDIREGASNIIYDSRGAHCTSIIHTKFLYSNSIY